MTDSRKRVTTVPVTPDKSETFMAPPKNPAFKAEGGTDTVFVCPTCSAVIGEYQPGYQIEMVIKCADCGTFSKIPDSFWRSVRKQ